MIVIVYDCRLIMALSIYKVNDYFGIYKFQLQYNFDSEISEFSETSEFSEFSESSESYHPPGCLTSFSIA